MTTLLVEPANSLLERIKSGNALVGVVGLGYVGLPLIDAFVSKGFSALGFDIDEQKVELLNQGKSYIAHIKTARVASWRENDRFEATTDLNRLGEPDAILICVPTPLNESRDPDLQYVIDSTAAVARCLRPGQLIVLESTTWPGTTREVMLPVLEESGLVPGKDFFLAYSPEREDPGNPNYGASTIPKVVGGWCPASMQLAAELYGRAIASVVPVSSCEVAEACKILENTYRSINIAMVNELKVLFHKIGIDIWEVIDAARTKPFGFQAFFPGPGLGGHCIPIDPFYLTWVARKHEMPTRFIELAGEINTAMPHYVLERVTEALNHHGRSVKGSRIGILGLAYKKDIDDPRESPAFKLMDLLSARGAELSYSDPHIPRVPGRKDYGLHARTSSELTPEYLRSLDCVLIATDHSAFDWDEIVRHAKLVVDTRNATRNVVDGREKIWKS